MIQLHLDLRATVTPLVKTAITWWPEKCGPADPVFERGSSCGSRWLVTQLAALESMGWIRELIVWCADHGVTLSGGRGLAGAVVDDVALVDLAQPSVDRLMLQRVAHKMGAWWLS